VYSLFGGLSVSDGVTELTLGTRKQRAVLAQLVLADGQVVTSDRLIDGIWGEQPPDRAEASLQAYVSGLRRILEPDRAPRAPATILLTRGTGYALHTQVEQVDVRRFTSLIEDAKQRHAGGDSTTAASSLRTALALYSTLLPEFEGYVFRDEASERFDTLFGAALELSYEVRLASGESALLATELDQAVRRQPLNEALWGLLATARYRMGRQSDALAALAEARRILSAEIGVDPGPRLQELERDILAHAPHLDTRPQNPSRTPAVRGPALPTADPTQPETDREPKSDRLIGRFDELARLHDAVVSAAGGTGSVVLVEGEPGAGKTALIAEAAHRAHESGNVRTVWGRCLEGGATPSLWPWLEILTSVLPTLLDDDRADVLATDLGRLIAAPSDTRSERPDVGAQFRVYSQATELFEKLSATEPVIVVVDDIQWADSASLELLTHLAARQLGRVVIIGAIRSGEWNSRATLRTALAELSRLPTHRRITVGPLATDDVSELIRRETGTWPVPDLVKSVNLRTKGNAFFVREIARVLLDSGSLAGTALASSSVPAGVRDVVRGRLATAPQETLELLDLAALIGKQVDIELLSGAAALPVDETLDRLEPAEALSVVETDERDPFTIHFAHDLVREAIVENIAPLRARRLHLRVAEQLARPGRTASLERLAHHLWSAGPLSDRKVTARALLDAAGESVRHFSYETAQWQLETCIQLSKAADDQHVELEAIVLLLGVIGARDGYLVASSEYGDRGETLARALGEHRHVADLQYSRWAAYSQSLDLEKASALATEMLRGAEKSDDPAIQVIGHQAWGVNEWDHGNIGGAYRSLSRAQHIRESTRSQFEMHGLQHDWELLGQAFLAWMTTMHRGVAEGRAYFAMLMESTRGDAYGRNACDSFAMLSSALACEPEWTTEVGRTWLETVADGPFDFLRAYTESVYWWSQVMLGDTDHGLIRLRELRPGVEAGAKTGWSAYYSLYAEAALVANRVDEVPELLDAADRHMAVYGQRYAHPHMLMVRARHLDTLGERSEAVAKMKEAKSVAEQQESTTLLGLINKYSSEFGS
jgi:DNA-binding SARP family transcriptional activator